MGKPRLCDCGKVCAFNYPDVLPAVKCYGCCLPGMINVKNKRCGCDKKTINPKFNFPGISPGVCCASCREPGMENIKDRRCGCKRRILNPNFNLPGEKFGICCKQCKTNEMVDIQSKKCKCGTRVGFGFPDGTKECCVKCKLPGMIDLSHSNSLCDCGVRAGYGFPGGDKECCGACRRPGMVDLAHVNDLCECGSRVSYGFSGGALEKCAKCASPDMIPSYKNCECGSGLIPIYSNDGGDTKFCSKCRTPDMTNVVSRRCPGYNGNACPNDVVCLYGYCAQCDPDDTRRTTHKRYEYAFFDYLKDYAKPVREHWVNTLTGRYRIDGIIVNGSDILCIEVDEYAHKATGYKDDDIRQESITRLFIEKYDTVAWVRVNPNCERKLMNDDYDAYLKVQEETQNTRHLLAKDAILRLVDNPSSTTVLVY